MKTLRSVGMLVLIALGLYVLAQGTTPRKDTTKKKILIVITSHDQLGNTGKHTGYTYTEVARPWKVFKDAGYEVDFVSPLGGQAPIDKIDKADAATKEFQADSYYQEKLKHSMKPEEVNPGNYSAIFFAGGHGAMWDFPNNQQLIDIAMKIYANNGIVSALCHGASALVNAKLPDGTYLLAGKNVTCFSNSEEKAMGMDAVIPFKLENKLIERGAKYHKSGNMKEHVEVDGRLVTGQNPASSKKVAEEMVSLVKKKNKANNI